MESRVRAAPVGRSLSILAIAACAPPARVLLPDRPWAGRRASPTTTGSARAAHRCAARSRAHRAASICATTPTISRITVARGCAIALDLEARPTAWRPFRKRRTNASSTMQTVGALALSADVKPRPLPARAHRALEVRRADDLVTGGIPRRDWPRRIAHDLKRPAVPAASQCGNALPQPTCSTPGSLATSRSIDS